MESSFGRMAAGIFLVSLAVLLGHSSALADGKFVPPLIEEYPSIPMQRAIIKYRNNVETLIIESTLNGKGQDFAWVIPVPTIPLKIEKMTPGLLETLSLRLRHTIIDNANAKLSFSVLGILFYSSCLILIFMRREVFIPIFVLSVLVLMGLIMAPNLIRYGAGGPGAGINPKVNILQHNTIGNYEAFLLQSDMDADLNSWLAKRNFKQFENEELHIINDYSKKGWYFIIARLIRENGEISTPHPILIEFKTDRPVYPMRLSADPDQKMLLDIFFIAEQEGIPENYDLRKIYCDVFIPGGWYDLAGKLLVGRSRLPLSDNRHTLPDSGIGHPDHKKIMWDGCVVSRYSGEVSGDQMKQDMLFSLKPPEPFAAEVHSYHGAFVRGLGYVALTLFIGFWVLLILRRSNSGSKRNMMIAGLIVLPLICIVVQTVSFGLSEKVHVQRLDIHRWDYHHMRPLQDALVDFFAIPQHGSQPDEELIALFNEKMGPSARNLFTGEPIKLEDSPGNMIFQREDGELIGIIVYQQNGVPINL